uniref:Uncharacterized protein n=1 Tax=Capra hircus TaxID=9925 RepID=A0A8C2P7J9_CAPHI
MYPSNKKKKVWREEKERLLKMTIEERRKEYIRDYVPLNTIPSYHSYLFMTSAGHLVIEWNNWHLIKRCHFCYMK